MLSLFEYICLLQRECAHKSMPNVKSASLTSSEHVSAHIKHFFKTSSLKSGHEETTWLLTSEKILWRPFMLYNIAEKK